MSSVYFLKMMSIQSATQLTFLKNTEEKKCFNIKNSLRTNHA
jgi:hypothetical protein